MASITLRRMNEPEFHRLYNWMIIDYGQELSRKKGLSPEAGLQQSRQETEDLIPGGRFNPQADMFTALNPQGEAVGALWYLREENPRSAFIANLVVWEPHRRQGYGRQIMLAMEDEARRNNLPTIALHVFAQNTPARALYEQLGYTVTQEEPGSIYMQKKVVAAP